MNYTTMLKLLMVRISLMLITAPSNAFFIHKPYQQKYIRSVGNAYTHQQRGRRQGFLHKTPCFTISPKSYNTDLMNNDNPEKDDNNDSLLLQQRQQHQEEEQEQYDDNERTITPKLGIDIGRQMGTMNETEVAALKMECANIINKVVEDGIHDMEKIHAKLRRDIDRSSEQLTTVMNLNQVREAEKFNQTVNHIVGKFLNDTATSRERTHTMAAEDIQRQKQKEMEEKEKKATKKVQSWKSTNDPWDEVDDWSW